MRATDAPERNGLDVTLKREDEGREQRASKPLWLSILIFLPVLIFVAYIMLVLFHFVDDVIHERLGG